MSLTFCKVNIRIHLLLPFLWIFYFLTGQMNSLFPALFALFIHEFGHLVVAKAMQISVQSLEITPYGGVISFSNLELATSKELFLIAAAGPAFSLLGCISMTYFCGTGFFSNSFSEKFFQHCFLLFLVNLLPVLPLDGGKMLQALLKRFISGKNTGKVLVRAGYGLGALFCVISIYYACKGMLHLSPAFAGAYLIYSSSKEESNEITHYMNCLIARRTKLDQLRVLSCECLAVKGEMPLYSVIGKLNREKFHKIIVLSSDGLEIAGTLFDKDVIGFLLSGNSQLTLLECIEKNKQQFNVPLVPSE